MLIILKRIPRYTEKNEIVDFLTPILNGRFFQKQGYIRYINILTLRDNDKNTFEYHGLVDINPEQVANRIIKQLHKNLLNDKSIRVKEYFHRSWHNDPRVSMHQWNEELDDKRKHSRRRPRLEIINKA
jgi:hypothetical protein